jgi:Protein of unknown function (DUF4232)
MKLHPSTAAAVGFVAAGFIVTGCSTNSSSPASTSPSTPATATPAATASPIASAVQPTTQPAGSPSSSPGQAAGGGTCQAAALSYALGAVTGTSAQRTQAVVLTNKGSSACTLQGFPGVDLSGIANGQQNYSWSLERQSDSYTPVTLQPGAAGHFTVIYLPGTSASGDMTVNKLIITPPNDYTQAEVTWNQSVVLQDGATHPGTYITPVVAGS